MPPAPDSALGRALSQLVSMLNSGAGEWPSSLPASATVDTGLLLRLLRTASAWAGHCQPGACCQGDGETSAAVELSGATAKITLAIVVDPVEHLLQQVEIALRT